MLGLLKWVLNDSIWFFKNFTKNFFSIEKVWDFFEKTEKNHQLDSWNKFHYLDWNIQIKKMNFSYWKNIIFKDFSLELKGWSKTALVWLSGSGKTTLVKLISWFLTSYGWDIIIDWQNLKELDLRTLYRNIWYLSQEPSVFDWKIIENLLYGIDWETVDDDFIDKIISLAHCEFIYDFQDWLDTEIWEKWVRLSWWQKQRIAIAKVFLKNPNIIILDEPTSALDSFSEELISSSFDELFIWKTVLIIAHRLQTVQKSNEIIVFDWWEVIERWSHKILIERNWAYKKMLDLQSWF
jgi:ABC-type multidrug transport system fused ATPase/permease subunit